MKKKNVLLIVVLFVLFSANCVFAQNHTSAVGVYLPTGTTAYSPLHVYRGSASSSAHVKSGCYMWSTYSMPSWLSGFPQMSVNKNVFVYSSGSSYPDGYIVHDGFQSDMNPTNPRTNSNAWWERVALNGIQRWGHQAQTFMTLMNDGTFGIGVEMPDAKLHVFNSAELGSALNNSSRITTLQGNPKGTVPFKNSLWLRRDAAGSTWETTRLHDGVTTAANSSTPGTNTYTWWERDPKDTIQAWGNKADTYMVLKGGKLGIGTENPTSTLHVNGVIKANGLDIDAMTFDNLYVSYLTNDGGPVVIVGPGLDVDGILNTTDINADGKLTVKEIEVTKNVTWADHVFNDDYNLLDLKDVEAHIKQFRHLPDVPSAAQVAEKGINLVEMNVKLLQKVEELTLYIIEQNSRITELENNK